MNAIDIIEAIRKQGANTKESILAALQDGQALATLGVTNADQTEVEDAHELITNAGLNFTLNEAGQKALLAEIQGLTNDTLTNPQAYFEDAENDASRWNSGEDASIEINKIYTLSGNPEIISLKKEWFDSEIVY